MHGVILMTALIPTVGHGALCEFSANFMNNYNGTLSVIISSRSFEPIAASQRLAAITEFCNKFKNVNICLHEDDYAPQNPNTEQEWNYWYNTILKFSKKPDFIFASEKYGIKVAKLFNADFIPFDIDRKIFPCKGTNVRINILSEFNNILPEFKKYLQTKIVLFGQESVGKTTMTNRLFNKTKKYSSMIHEFARPYLELMDDKSVTEEKMKTITIAQNSLEQTAFSNGKLLLWQDTDLLSTIGYYRIMQQGEPDLIKNIFNPSDLYIVMNDEIPFEQDCLRYGGNKRESTKQFWIDLLKQYNCKYYIVKNTNIDLQEKEILKEVKKYLDNKFRKIKSFIRD